ncbi:MAG: DUF4905 domain-containing protein [Arcicella sp.]|jgi:hypothetical protein|nr:DUF4905 domain-containing protein [Arcicella sp.]
MMEQKISHIFSGKIWHTAFNNERCVLEIRNEATRQVSFSALDLQQGKVLWENYQPLKSWWLGLVGLFDEYIIIHQYSSEQKPEPEGVLVIDVNSGTLVLNVADVCFHHYENNQLTVVKNSLFQTIPLDVQRQSNDSVVEIGKTLHESVQHYSEASPYFTTIFKFLYRLLGIEAQKAVDYLEISNKIIISYYIYRENLFHNYLLVTNREQKIILHEHIATTEGIGINTFTVQSDTLLYVKNENEFIGYEL